MDTTKKPWAVDEHYSLTTQEMKELLTGGKAFNSGWRWNGSRNTSENKNIHLHLCEVLLAVAF